MKFDDLKPEHQIVLAQLMRDSLVDSVKRQIGAKTYHMYVAAIKRNAEFTVETIWSGLGEAQQNIVTTTIERIGPQLDYLDQTIEKLKKSATDKDKKRK